MPPSFCDVSGTCVSSAVPTPVQPPTLSADGGVVRAADGVFKASDGGAISTTRRWLRCAADGGSCVPLTMGGLFTGTNLQTDATRAQATSGDGLPQSSSVGTWSSATNQIVNGGMESNASGWGAWADTGNSSHFPSLGRDTGEHKFGAASLKVTTSGAEPGQEVISYPSVAASTAYLASAWVKGPPGASLCIGADELNASNVFVKSFAVYGWTTASGSWERIVSTGTTSSTTASLHVLIGTCASTGQALTFWIDGAQVERGTAPTPYVETAGSTAMRPSSTLSGPTSLLTPDQGWAAFRVHPGWTAATANQPSPTLLVSAVSVTNRLTVYFGRSSGAWALERNNGTQNAVRVPRPADAGVDTVVAAWTPAQLQLSVSGSPFARLSSNQVPTGLPPTFDLATLDGETAWVAFGSGTLDDAQAATLHAFGDTDPPFDQLPKSTTVLWTADALDYRAAVTGASYAPSPADMGYTLVLEVTATNANGSVTVTSSPFGPL
jgi:hypothetical protein